MKYKVTLNNRIYEVVVEEASAMLLDEYEAEAPAPCAVAKQEAVTADPAMIPIPSKAGAASNSLVSGEVVRAPMPGNVLKMEVAQGQEVEEGDLLLVLEAMKMENDIRCFRRTESVRYSQRYTFCGKECIGPRA